MCLYLHVMERSGPAILLLICYSDGSSLCGISDDYCYYENSILSFWLCVLNDFSEGFHTKQNKIWRGVECRCLLLLEP